MSPTPISWPMPNGLTDGPRTNTDNGGNCPEMSGATVSDRHVREFQIQIAAEQKSAKTRDDGNASGPNDSPSIRSRKCRD
jgi:hypothetical protein